MNKDELYRHIEELLNNDCQEIIDIIMEDNYQEITPTSKIQIKNKLEELKQQVNTTLELFYPNPTQRPHAIITVEYMQNPNLY